MILAHCAFPSQIPRSQRNLVVNNDGVCGCIATLPVLHHSSSSISMSEDMASASMYHESMECLSNEVLPKFLKSKISYLLILRLREREIKGIALALKTVACGLCATNSNLWLDMFRAMSETFAIGIAVVDNAVESRHVVAVNDGFRRVTGFGAEIIGKSVYVVQGLSQDTEFVQRLVHHENALLKLSLLRSDGRKIQCVVALHPVEDSSCKPHRIYQVMVVLDLGPLSDVSNSLKQMERLLSTLPTVCVSSDEKEVKKYIPQELISNDGLLHSMGHVVSLCDGSGLKELREACLVDGSLRWKGPNILKGSDSCNEMVALVSKYCSRPLNYEKMIVALTKILWLQDPLTTCRGVLADEILRSHFSQYAETNSSAVMRAYILFYVTATEICYLRKSERLKTMIERHRQDDTHNPLWLCTTNTRTKDSEEDSLVWRTRFKCMSSYREKALAIITSNVLIPFLESNLSSDMILMHRKREVCNEELFLHTVAYKIDRFSETYWLDLFRVVADKLSVGVLVTDMSAINSPVVYVNEGFKNITGYGNEALGASGRCMFGPNEEVANLLQQSESIYATVHNYNAAGHKYRCVMALHPIFGIAPKYEYKYQIIFILNSDNTGFNNRNRVLEVNRILRFLPKSMGGETQEEVAKMELAKLTKANDFVRLVEGTVTAYCFL